MAEMKSMSAVIVEAGAKPARQMADKLWELGSWVANVVFCYVCEPVDLGGGPAFLSNRPRCLRIICMSCSSSMNDKFFIFTEHLGHITGSISYKSFGI